jgi:hypothetical protein
MLSLSDLSLPLLYHKRMEKHRERLEGVMPLAVLLDARGVTVEEINQLRRLLFRAIFICM